MDLQKLFESTNGKLILVALIVLILIVSAFSKKDDKKLNVKSLTFSAVLIALAFILNNITLFKMPQGGSVTPFSMLLIVLVGFYFNPKIGIAAGVAFGLLDMLINPYIIHPLQALLDYPLAFGMLGLGGLFIKGRDYKSLAFIYIIGVFLRFICSALSGYIFFSEYAPEGFNAVLWTIVYNGSFMSVEMILTLIVMYIPSVKNMIMRIKSSTTS